MKKYNHKAIEKKWQKLWAETADFDAHEDSDRPKFYGLIEFPYPSGNGLHVGHIRSSTAMDIIVRKRRREGYSVLYPIGWDAFGLPTENHALKTGISPQEVTKKNTDTFRRQLKALGFSFDWSREINTTDPSYYRWTQWIFLKLFEKGLAYKKKMPINWCIDCKSGLANEEVVDLVCERCGSEVEMREKEQWMLKITEYAERLDKDLDTVDYLEKIKVEQRNWIGRSEGVEIEFKISASGGKGGKNESKSITVFTTRPDTLFGATHLVLAPEHPALPMLKSSIKNSSEVEDYIKETQEKKEIERTAVGREKTGVRLLGATAINPANGQEIPIFIADYVLVSYGTGAIMAVPAHDERDFLFAQAYDMPVTTVIEPVTGTHHDDEEHRMSIVALLYDKKNNKVLSINWGDKLGGNLLIGGGLGKDEDPVSCAKREIEEETGYTDMTLIAQSETIHHHYFAASKDVHRVIDVIGLFFELNSEDQVDQKLEDDEKGKFSIEWLPLEEARTKIQETLHKYIFEKFIDTKVYTGEGLLTNSGDFTGMKSEEAKSAITKFVGGEQKTTFRLRDWIFSRQRYWGEPIPIIHCEKCGAVPVPESDLPVELPKVERYEPTDSGESPLAGATEWLSVPCPTCGGRGRRETDTMPNWAGSSWYYLRYADPHNDKVFADEEKLAYWTPVDWYNGGMEHTTLHLLYSRFWHKFLYDIKVVPTSEPYKKRTSHGMILAEGGEKMSKSKGNVINPDEIVEQFGADTLRLYEMFMGPFEESISWGTDNIIGPRRFLEKVWRLREKVDAAARVTSKIEEAMHKMIKKVGEDIEKMHFNTAVSTLMIFVNDLEGESTISQEIYGVLLNLLAPFSPHISEELWEELGNSGSIHKEPWPAYDESKVKEMIVTIAVQVNGKVRGDFEIAPNTPEKEVKKMALALPQVEKWRDGKEPKRVIYVKGRLVSIVV